MQPRQRPPGAADGVEGAPGAGLEQLGAGERLAHHLLGLLDLLRRHVLQREPAERQRDAGRDALPMYIGQFQRAAAEIAGDAVRAMEAGDDAERRQFGFALAGDHVDLGAAQAFGRGDEGFAVAGVAAGRGRNGEALRHAHAVAQRAEALERAERLVNSVGGQESGRVHLAAKPGQYLLVEDRRRAAREALIDHEPHRVRADVNHRDRRPVIETALRGGHGGLTPPKNVRGGV